MFGWGNEREGLEEEAADQREERRVGKRDLAIGLHGISVENRLI